MFLPACCGLVRTPDPKCAPNEIRTLSMPCNRALGAGVGTPREGREKSIKRRTQHSGCQFFEAACPWCLVVCPSACLPAKASTARPTTCKHQAGQEQEASCEPTAAKIRTASLCDYSYVNTENNFRTAHMFFDETGVAQYSAAKLLEFSGVNIANSFRKALFFDMEPDRCTVWSITGVRKYMLHLLRVWSGRNPTDTLRGLLSTSKNICCICFVFGWPWAA